MNHSERAMDIDTVEQNRFCERKFDEDTSKTIKFFMDSCGFGARSVMRQFLDAKFKTAWITLDWYYNTSGGVEKK